MDLKVWLAGAAGAIFALVALYAVFVQGHVDTATGLYVGLALLSFAEAAGALDHESIEGAEIRRERDRLEARRAADRVAREAAEQRKP